MFGRRFTGLKLGAAGTTVALMGLLSWTRADSINPDVWRCLAQPARWAGTALWVPSATVVESGPGGFTIESEGTRVRVAGDAAVSPGDGVSLTGTFRAEGPRIDLLEVRKLPPRARLRWLAEAVSLAVLALVVANFLRHFAFRPRALQVHGNDS